MSDSNQFWKQLRKVIPGKCSFDNKFSLIDKDTYMEIEESKAADYLND